MIAMLKVINVEYLGDYVLLCSFNNGQQKIVDLAPLLQYPAFEELKDKEQFLQFGNDTPTDDENFLELDFISDLVADYEEENLSIDANIVLGV